MKDRPLPGGVGALQPHPDIPERILLVAHVLVTGPLHELHHYLVTRCKRLICLQYPLQPGVPSQEVSARYQEYQDGLPVYKRTIQPWPMLTWAGREFPSFFWHGLMTFWWGVGRARGSDLMIGINPFNAFLGLCLRQLGCVQSVVYYTIDYIPQRFPNRWLNALYHWVDRFCVRHADQVWNLSSRMISAREARGISPRYRQKQRTVPVGTDLRVRVLPLEQVDRWTIVYFGALMEKQGVQLGIAALPLVRRRIPQAKLLVIGGGSPKRREALQHLAESLKVADAVEFTGVIEDHAQALRRLSHCAVGIAPYVDDSDSYTRNTDPGKPKAYLSAGLPVVLTDVPEVAQTIAQAGAGFVVPYEPEALAQALDRLLTDEALFISCRRQARALAEQYDWNRIFAQAFAGLKGGTECHTS